MKIFQNLYNIFYICFIILKQNIKFLYFKNNLKYIKDISKELEARNVTYIKILQGICVNSNLFNQEQINFLLQYTDNVPFTHDEIDKSFINLIHKNNVKITSFNPINAGIIAVVYEGTYFNQKIVIKVLKKNIPQKLNNAFNELELFFKICSYIPFIKSFQFSRILKNNKDSIMTQVNFKKECENIKHFSEATKNLDYVKIPIVYEEFTNQNSNIIVMEYMEGLKYKEIQKLNKLEFLDLIIRFHFISIFFHGLGHADLHPGNIIFVNKEPKKIALIDFGLIIKIDKLIQNSIYEFLKEIIIEKNYYKAALQIKVFTEPKEQWDILLPETQEIIFNKISKIVKKYWVEEPTLLFVYYCNNILKEYKLYITKEFSQIQLSIISGVNLQLGLLEKDITELEKYQNPILKELLDFSVLSIPD